MKRRGCASGIVKCNREREKAVNFNLVGAVQPHMRNFALPWTRFSSEFFLSSKAAMCFNWGKTVGFKEKEEFWTKSRKEL